jgi:putative DNA primase/helicase
MEDAITPKQNSQPHQSADENRNELSPANKETASVWPDPQPIGFVADARDYPLDALPSTIRAAVEEVAGYTQAPLALVAASALGAVSIATQGLVDVARSDKLTGPISLYLLTIAESGERKSSADGFFSKPIHEWVCEAKKELEPEIARYRSEIATWESKHSGIKDKIKKLAKDGEATDIEEVRLCNLEREKPQSPMVPRILFHDITPEALAYSLATGWPSAGVSTSEAGTVLGAHGMGKDSMVRNLALLNTLWDGGNHIVDRRTSESLTVSGARLTMCLSIQDATLRTFFGQSGAIARGIGWMARFLLSWPESTQGTRFYSEAPECWPSLEVFHKRLKCLLNTPLAFDGSRRLQPVMLRMSSAAKEGWIAYHDKIEGELWRGGELIDVRDVASKSADNAARLAAQFQLFEYGQSEIGLEILDGATRLAEWHLNESRRYFGEMAQAPELSDAARLDRWIIEYLKTIKQSTVPRRHVQQCGPVRDRDRLSAALSELVDLDRMRLSKQSKKLLVEVNPTLLAGI